MLEHGAAHARYLQGVQKPCAGFICSLSVGGTGSFRKSERTVFAGGSCTNKQEDVILCILQHDHKLQLDSSFFLYFIFGILMVYLTDL